MLTKSSLILLGKVSAAITLPARHDFVTSSTAQEHKQPVAPSRGNGNVVIQGVLQMRVQSDSSEVCLLLLDVALSDFFEGASRTAG